MKSLLPLLFLILAVSSSEASRRILVFGGNGFLGGSTVEHLVDNGDNVTIVNRGNWYWDSNHRIRPFVDHISCDRKNGIDSCQKFVDLINSVDQFDAVIDFSAYSDKETRDAGAMLKDKSKLYVLISTDSIYDVCVKDHDGPSKETDDKRPDEQSERLLLAKNYDYGNRKLLAEEELIKHRNQPGGIPYVILRLPDVIGPRDTTHRWWIYQLWIKLEKELSFRPISMPPFLKDYPLSVVYSEDVASLIVNLLSKGSEIQDEVFNIAYPETFTLDQIIRGIHKYINNDAIEIKEEANQTNTVYLYPSVRKGPIDVSKAEEMLGWKPTPWEEAFQNTITFYEEAMKSDRFETQRDEIIQIMIQYLYEQHKDKFYSSVENTYNISLKHFRPHDEL